ncbi:MAG TPA: hypothetical protein VGX37_00115 [Allosphingosinicella sp.]|nr:hypothetical protein [Allosphingosinicella sp.]
MKNNPASGRRSRRLAFVLALMWGGAAAAQAQTMPPPSGVSYDMPAVADEGATPEAPPPSSRPRRSRPEIHPYLEVDQVISAELDGGDTLTYTSVAAGVDGRVQTRRITVQASYRYQRNIEWSGDVGDQDVHSGVAMVNAQIVPGAVQLDAGALATRTGGQGRALGVTDRDESVEVYSAYAGPTVSTHAGPVTVNAGYRLGYVAIDDDTGAAGRGDDDGSAVAHAASVSAGMAPGELPVGWGVNAGYQRTDSDGEFDHEFEGRYIRGDVVVPVSPTLAATAGVGYENIQASQRDIARDANGNPVVGPDGIVADPNRRVLTYDVDGVIYDAGITWRPTQRTALEARAGHRYGGTTFVGTLSHQFSPHLGMNAAVFDSVQTFSNLLLDDISHLPDDFHVRRDPLTGSMGGCVFGNDPGRGVCLDRSLQSIRSNSFRLRGASLVFSGRGRIWSWGVGADYSHRRYGRPDDPAFDLLGGATDESVSLSATASRRLSRTSDLGLDVFASWFDTDEVDFDRVFSAGANVSYSRSFMLERLRLLAALGLYHSDDGEFDSTVASGLLGLRYGF